MTREDIFHAINLERARQEMLCREGRFAFTLNRLHVDHVDDFGVMPVPVTNLMRYPILAEEVGEVARAMNDGDDANLKEELLQCAALCCAWLEAL